MASQSPGALHLKGLNGLRAFSALAVVISHTRLAQEQFGFPKASSLQLAMYGVTVFFALSGFLITYLLMMEQEQTRTVDVKRFYIRRVLRIWPLYYFYLVLTLVALWLTQPEALSWQVFFYFFLMANVPFIWDRAIPKVDHYWSLGVEEQFYLFWPWLIKNLKRPVFFILWGIGLFLFAKGIAGYIKARTGYSVPYLIFSVNRFDCMAIGALGAILCFQRNQRFLDYCTKPIVQILVWTGFVLVAFNFFKIHPFLNHEVVSLMAVIAIVNLAFNPKSWVSLDFAVLDFLGKISFGIYVYHPLVIAGLLQMKNMILPDLEIHLISQAGLYVLVAGSTILVSWASYQWIERPFLKRKVQYAIVKSSGSRAEAV